MTDTNKLTSDDVKPGPFSEHELREQWNSQADKFNQWDSLDGCEQLAWAQTRAIEAGRKENQRRLYRLQQENHRFREPERTILCDLLANGDLLPDPTGTRYGLKAETVNSPIRDALERLLFDIEALADSSSGVQGLHQNGDLAPWSQLLESGEFSSWLGDAMAVARAALALLSQSIPGNHETL